VKNKFWIVLVVLVGISSAIALGWWIYDRLRADAVPPGFVVASGRLEATDVRVAATTGGRVLELLVRKGDLVKQGQLVATIDRRGPEALTAGAHASAGAAEEAVVAADRKLAALESQLSLARVEAERYRRLAAREAVSRQAADRAEATLIQVENEVQAARAARALAVRQTEAARAQAAAVHVQLDETSVVAPVSGIVEDEVARAGEVVAPGAPIVRIRRNDEITLKVYLPIADAERVSQGLDARGYLDGFPERIFGGTVERVANEAEFTPKDIHMPDDRTTLVFAVDIRFANLDGTLKDGFPADAYIRWDRNASWPTKRPWR
jgi:HlyD family secretion protein